MECWEVILRSWHVLKIIKSFQITIKIVLGRSFFGNRQWQDYSCVHAEQIFKMPFKNVLNLFPL